MQKSHQRNEELRHALTKEMIEELSETFDQASESMGYIPLSKLPVVLRAIGMSMSEVDKELLQKEIDYETFLEIVLSCMRNPTWAANEMSESYAIFDKDNTGNISTVELRNVFSRLGENLLETELKDQLREFDIDGDLMMAVAEYYKMVCTTRGSDFDFGDSHF